MNNVKAMLSEAVKAEDSALLWRAVKNVTDAELRSFRSDFASCYKQLDRTQQTMFKSMVALHGHTLSREKLRELDSVVR